MTCAWLFVVVERRLRINHSCSATKKQYTLSDSLHTYAACTILLLLLLLYTLYCNNVATTSMRLTSRKPAARHHSRRSLRRLGRAWKARHVYFVWQTIALENLPSTVFIVFFIFCLLGKYSDSLTFSFYPHVQREPATGEISSLRTQYTILCRRTHTDCTQRNV